MIGKGKIGNNPVGRPSVVTDETITKLEHAFALDATVREACFYAGISTVAYYNLLEKQPEYKERFNALREKPILVARETIVKAIHTNPELALKYLERKRKDEFSLKTENTTELKGGINLTDILKKVDE